MTTRTPCFLGCFVLCVAAWLLLNGCENGDGDPTSDASLGGDATNADMFSDAALPDGDGPDLMDTRVADAVDASTSDVEPTDAGDLVADADTSESSDGGGDTGIDTVEVDVAPPPEPAWARTLSIETFSSMRVCSAGRVQIGPALEGNVINSEWLEFQAGTYQVWTEPGIRPSCQGSAGGENDISLREGRSYTLLAEFIGTIWDVRTIEDDLSPPAAGRAAVRVIDRLSPVRDDYDVCIGGNALTSLRSLSTGASDNLETDAGEIEVELRATSPDGPCVGDVAWTFATELTPDSVHTWLLIEDNDEVVHAHLCLDSTLGERVDARCVQVEAAAMLPDTP